jgi:ferredoxin
MTHIVTQACISCRYTDCVDVCPVDCFHATPNFLAIDPEECIDCGLCIAECPVNAIKTEYDLQPQELVFIKINHEVALKWPVINKKDTPLPQAEFFKNTSNKLNLLIK